MKFGDFVTEGGWDSTATQSTVITPQVVRTALTVVTQFTRDFNKWLKAQGLPPIEQGSPTGSSAHHKIDADDKIYGDIDMQMIAQPVSSGTNNQFTSYWNQQVDAFLAATKPMYVESAKNGHVIFSIGQEAFVQVDFMWATAELSDWARYRTTPEQGVKGTIYGNLYSTLGEIMGMSIQHAGVQVKIKADQPINFQRGRKEDRVDTLTTDIGSFALDMLKGLYQRINGSTAGLKIDPELKAHPGLNRKDIRIADLVSAIKGLARSFQLNDMYGKYTLIDIKDYDDFIGRFLQHYIVKAEEAANATKFDKAATPEALARAEEAKQKLRAGVAQVKALFQG
jgi:hypothetical protein